jgi:hypothetical protein
MIRIGDRLAQQRQEGRALGKVPYFWPVLIPRNLCFLAVVLCHGLRRLAPPY